MLETQCEGRGLDSAMEQNRSGYDYLARSMILTEMPFTKTIILLKIAIIIPAPIAMSARLKM